MELHFYPGQKLLALLDGNTKARSYEAWGGPASIGNDPRMAEEPTWPGHYVIAESHAYRTNTWQLSRIKWGTPLQDKPNLNDVWYQLANGNWASIKNDHQIERQQIINLYYDLYNTRKVPSAWVFNDFGPIAIRWYKDLNGNRRMDGSERLSGQMFHTTPDNEAQQATGKPVIMTFSHGCIHLKPNERDLLITAGAFKPGTTFIVHKYHETFK